jgi:uncharacterized protein YyaL (SSP411 family)
MLINGAVELVIIGDPKSADFSALERAAAERYVPSLVIAGGSPRDDVALLADRVARDARATAYVCRGYTCEEPATDASALGAQLATAAVRTGT